MVGVEIQWSHGGYGAHTGAFVEVIGGGDGG